MEVNGRVAPVFQACAWNEEESMTGLLCSFGGENLCAPTGKPIGDKDSEYVKKSNSNRLYMEGRLCMQRFKKYFPFRHED